MTNADNHEACKLVLLPVPGSSASWSWLNDLTGQHAEIDAGCSLKFHNGWGYVVPADSSKEVQWVKQRLPVVAAQTPDGKMLVKDPGTGEIFWIEKLLNTFSFKYPDLVMEVDGTLVTEPLILVCCKASRDGQHCCWDLKPIQD